MEIIIHRVNTVKELNKIPKIFGVEIDIRSHNSKLILNHDPHKPGDKFDAFLKKYNHGTLVLNIKEAGIEDEVLKKVKRSKIKSYFLLDIEFPYIFKCLKKKQKNLAIRFSENEPIENAKLMTKKFKWLWIDTLTKLPITKKNLKIIKGYKTCVVCPERWGRPGDIKKYIKKMNILKFRPSAVMTSFKYAKKWQKFL